MLKVVANFAPWRNARAERCAVHLKILEVRWELFAAHVLMRSWLGDQKECQFTPKKEGLRRIRAHIRHITFEVTFIGTRMSFGKKTCRRTLW